MIIFVVAVLLYTDSHHYLISPCIRHYQNTTQRQRKIKKLYLAVTTEPVPLGMHVHWMWKSLNARGQQGGTPCQFVSHTSPESRKKAKVSVFYLSNE